MAIPIPPRLWHKITFNVPLSFLCLVTLFNLDQVKVLLLWDPNFGSPFAFHVKVMEKMVEGLNNVGTGSVESLLLVSSALSTATAVYPILNRDSQDASSSLVNRLVRQLNERTIDSTQEELQQVAENIISTISSTFGVCQKPYLVCRYYMLTICRKCSFRK